MADRGLDLSAHRSRQLDADMLRRADLVIGMAASTSARRPCCEPDALREDLHAEGARPAARPRPASAAPTSRFDAWLGRIADARAPGALLGVGHDDVDVADPVGRVAADYEVTADLLDDLLGEVVALAFPARTRAEGQHA